MKSWNNPGKWRSNPLNFAEEVTADFELPDKIFVLDSTIRKMTGTPGSNWSAEGAVDITTMADEVGVGVVEVNLVHGDMPASEKLLNMFEAIAKTDHKFKLVGTAWTSFKKTIDDAIDHGADAVCMGWRNREQFLEAYEYARSRGVEVATSLGSRIRNIPPDEGARGLNKILSEVDPIYVGIHENTGATTPEAWRYYMKKLRAGLIKDVPIVPHIHNMLGGATMSAVAAVTGGAKGLDLSMNGIAIHCGLAALEEVVVILEVLYGVDTGIKLEKLRQYSQVVVEATGIPVHRNKPIVGDHAFIVELESFVKDVIEARERGQERVHMIAPSLVGHENVVVWGENTIHGPATKAKLKAMGLPYDDGSVEKAVSAIKRELEAKTEYPLYLTEEEVESLAREVLAQ